MPHLRLEFDMPAEAAVVFDAFHHQHWRVRWDTLVGTTRVQGGAPCPFLGAVTESVGAGLLRGVTMRTRFVAFDRPRLAAATMLEPAFPFHRWAASMQHRPQGPGRSRLVYTSTFDVGPGAWRRVLSPIVTALFARQTRRRFARLQAFLAAHAGEVARWQLQASNGQ